LLVQKTKFDFLLGARGADLTNELINEDIDRYLDLLFETMNKKDTPESIQRLFLKELNYLLSYSYLAQTIPHKIIKRFEKKNRRVPHWLKNMILGECHRKIAWKHRGGGYADTVEEKDWERFGKHLSIAEEHFEKAFQLNPNCPESASTMIAVSMANGSNLELPQCSLVTASSLGRESPEDAQVWSPVYENGTV